MCLCCECGDEIIGAPVIGDGGLEFCGPECLVAYEDELCGVGGYYDDGLDSDFYVDEDGFEYYHDSHDWL